MTRLASWLLVRLATVIAQVLIPDATDAEYDEYARGPQ